MLAKPYRLTKQEDFENVKSKGNKVSNALVTLLYLKGKNETYPRFGIIVSTKISKLATARNRIERALSEGVRQNIYNINKDYDCIVIARSKAVNAVTSDIMHSVSSAIQEANISKK